MAAAGAHVSSKSFGVRSSLQRLVYNSWYVSMGLSANINERGPVCGLNVSTHTQLWDQVRGCCTLNLGVPDGVKCSIIKAPSSKANSSWELGLDVGASKTVEVKSVVKLEEGIRLYSAATLDEGKDLIGAEFGLSQTFDHVSNSRANCGIKFSYLRGISVIMRFQKGNNRIQFPVALCNGIDENDVSTTQFTTALLLPVALYGVYRFWLRPRSIRSQARKKERNRVERETRAMSLRRQAEDQQEMQKLVAQRKMRLERERDGLVISEAWYGKNVADQLSDEKVKEKYLEAPEGGDLDSFRIDAKIPMQFQVQSGRLELVSGTKSLLPGLFDVAEQQKKQLFLKYTYQGETNEVVIADEQSLFIGAAVEQHDVPLIS